MSGLGPEEVVELKHGMGGIAELTYAFFTELRKQGFLADEALELTSTWLTASVHSSVELKGKDE